MKRWSCTDNPSRAEQPFKFRDLTLFCVHQKIQEAKKNKEKYLQEMEAYKKKKGEEAMNQKKEEEELLKLQKQEALQLLKKKEKTENLIKVGPLSTPQLISI